MGNTTSRDSSEEKKKYLKSLGRRKSANQLATIPTRFSSHSRQSIYSYWNQSSSTLDIQQHQPQQENHSHGFLDKIRHSNKSKHARNGSSTSYNTFKHHYYDNSIAAEDFRERSTSPAFSHSSKYEFNDTINEVLIIDKYTDSQMTLLNNHQNHLSQVDNQLYMTNNSNSTLDTATTTTTATNEFSSDILLNELFTLCETSPERRRDRDRRHRQHYLSKRTWGSNYKIPLHNPTFIIDWCCATAVWDIEIAFEFPNAKVIGIDYESVTVSSLTETVKNFTFQNAMIHQGKSGLETIENNTVDYIMMRDVMLVNSPVQKWINIFKEVYRILKPGGYIEIYEQDTHLESAGPNLSILEKWSDRFYEAVKLDRDTVNQLPTFLNDEGFTNIKCESKELPLGEWPDDKDLKETGYLQKDLIERKFRESKRWMCKFNNISEQEFASVLSKGIDECDEYNTFVRSLYYSAQKPPAA